MTYQAIVDLIRNTAYIVNPTGHFVHGRRSDGSLDYNEPFPQIHLMPVRSSIDYSNNTERSDIVILFWQQDSPESSNDEREAIIAQMDVLSRNFLQLLYDEDILNLANVLRTPEYRQLAGTVSGYGISFTIVDKTSCNPDPIFLATEQGDVIITEFSNVIIIE
jgi:hypothetical protein